MVTSSWPCPEPKTWPRGRDHATRHPRWNRYAASSDVTLKPALVSWNIFLTIVRYRVLPCSMLTCNSSMASLRLVRVRASCSWLARLDFSNEADHDADIPSIAAQVR